LACLLGLAWNYAAALGQQPEDDVRQTIKQYAEAWNAGDVQALRACWRDDGEFVDRDGRTHRFGEIIEDRMQAPGSDGNLSVAVSAVRFLSPDVALVDGSTILDDAQQQETGSAGFSAVCTRQDGKWVLARVHELQSPVSARNPLEQFAWTLGRWEGKTTDSKTVSTVTWSEQRKFLLRRFELIRDGRSILSGTERIGWDPVSRQIKSWFFDSDGTVAEGYWEKYGEQWAVFLTGTLEDGTPVSTTRVLLRVDDNTILRRSIETTVGDQELPDEEVRAVRTGSAR
jgi:uncharacterized protein (TIGR02246 family)